MGKAIPKQHPAVVLRSHYTQLRALLAVAAIALVGLTAAVVILATDDDRDASPSSVAPSSATLAPGTRYDGGPEEGTRGVARAHQPSARYDGGPEEGTRGLLDSSATSGAASPRASETPGTAEAQQQVENGRSITEPDEYLTYVKSLADYDHARDYGDKR